VREIPRGVARGVSLYLLGGTNGDDLAALVAALGGQVNDPIGTADHIEIVLNHKDGVAHIN